ncbi:MAG: 3-dehydroquinate synthase [Clostridiales bacterium]|nr:3-dehydroquinate synthase [Clostridiales bacterium]
MMKLNISLGERSYPIYINTDFSGLGKALSSAGVGNKIAIITDSNVEGFYLAEITALLSSLNFDVFNHVIEAGERNKNLDTVRGIYTFLAGLKLDRNSSILALGGGVTGDIAGFAAATFLRGINFIQVPTSLLAQADSSVGGKVGVDFEDKKNIIGAFYQPKFVYINVNTLKTLPERELTSGMAEVIKHAVIMDQDFFEYLDYSMDKIRSFDEDTLLYITKMNCTIKGGVVEKDEKEGDLRAILNFGHTFGHAIETVSGFEKLHGECVSVGIAGACRLANHLGMLDKATVGKVESLLVKAGLPVRFSGFDAEKVYETMFHDKKIKSGKLTFILPKSIGVVIQLGLDDELLIKKVISEIAV